MLEEDRIDTSIFRSAVTFDVATAAATVTVDGPPHIPYKIAFIADTSSNYSIAGNGNGSGNVTVTATATHAVTYQSTDTEFLQFNDRLIFDLTPSHASIALLYQGALGRTPDPGGLHAWEQLFDSEPASVRSGDVFTSLAGTAVGGLPNLAIGFTQSQEFKDKYGPLPDNQFVSQLYANVLDRLPDQAGITAWVSALHNGHTREWVLVGFVESAEAYHNAEVGYVGQTGTVHIPWLLLT